MNKVLFALLFITPTLLFSQIISNEKIVKLKDNLEDSAAIAYLSQYYPTSQIKRISPYANFYKISIPQIKALNLYGALAKSLIQYDKQIESNLQNYALEQRSNTKTIVPNDPGLGEQYYLTKTKAIQAWDITTGGKIYGGDSIVIAVFDGGFNLSHPDIDYTSIYKNKDEIPNNGIDDDKNEYVDDYMGLNVDLERANDIQDHKSTSSNNTHGNGIIGVIGAKANNDKFISGLIWNPKLLLVSSNRSTIADWLEGIYYIRHLREIYNSSNGQKGACIVAYNMSWGLDYKANSAFGISDSLAAVFCEVFDDLGEVGILSIGATDNEPDDSIKKAKNLDSIAQNEPYYHDIPTLCTSDYLIMVTSTQEDDTKIKNAAYGKISVDLGAPGQSILTLDGSNNTTYSNGTSFAAPQVSATVGLMYSVDEESVKSEIFTNPATTALHMKNIILEYADPVPDLTDKTVTGGRLNIFNSVFYAKEYFSSVNIQDETFYGINILQYQNNLIEIQLNETILKGKWQVFDAMGRLIKSNSIQNEIFSIDLNPFTSGIYFLKISSNQKSKTIKFIKS